MSVAELGPSTFKVLEYKYWVLQKYSSTSTSTLAFLQKYSSTSTEYSKCTHEYFNEYF